MKSAFSILLFLSALYSAHGMQYVPSKIEYLTNGTMFEVQEKPKYSKPCFTVHETACVEEYDKLLHASCDRLKVKLSDIFLEHIGKYKPHKLNPVSIITLKIALAPNAQDTHDDQSAVLHEDEKLPELEKALAGVINPTCRTLQKTTDEYREFFAIKDDSILQISFTICFHKIIDDYCGKQLLEKRTKLVKESVYEYQ